MKNKIPLIIITIGLVIGIGVIFLGDNKVDNVADKINKDSTVKENSEQIQNVEIREGIQYVTINAKGGYFPRVSTAKAGIPTKLIVKTDGTYDCSAALRINSVGFQKVLQNTGEETIDLGTPQLGPLQGVCGMGMYNFVVNFEK
jgi:plastocyanin domain-containing protein